MSRTGARPAGHEVLGLPAFPKTADGLFVTDADQRIQYWSPGAEKILGHAAQEVVGKHCYEVLVGRDHQGHPFCRSLCPVARNLRRGRPVRDYDVVVDAGDGRRLLINNSLVLWPRAEGTPLAMHLFREVKEQRQRNRASAHRARRLRTAVRDGAQPLPTRLSRREMTVLRLASEGLANVEIADRLGVSYFTVRNQVSSVLRKLGARHRLEAVSRAAEIGLL